MPDPVDESWISVRATPLGDVTERYAMTDRGLEFTSDAALEDGSEILPWDDIAEAGIATVELPAGKGGPDQARWIPGRLEFLVARFNDPARAGFMRTLPASEDRDAIVDALRRRLGVRWLDAPMSLEDARSRFGVEQHGETPKVVLVVIAVLAILVLLLVAALLLASVLLLPALVVAGVLVFRAGLATQREAAVVERVEPMRVADVSKGFVALAGRPVTTQPVRSGVSGVACVWWDMSLHAWSEDGDGSNGTWNPVIARHGGDAGSFVLEDETGRVTVWMRDARVVIERHTWLSEHDALPPDGVAMLAAAGFPWRGGTQFRVTEQYLALDQPVFVLGTLDEARHLPHDGDERLSFRIRRSIRTGAWRLDFVRRFPKVLRLPVATVIAFIGMFVSLGKGGERVEAQEHSPPPAVPPDERVVWHGGVGRVFVVSDRPGVQSAKSLRERARWQLAGGAVLVCFALYSWLD